MLRTLALRVETDCSELCKPLLEKKSGIADKTRLLLSQRMEQTAHQQGVLVRRSEEADWPAGSCCRPGEADVTVDESRQQETFCRYLLINIVILGMRTVHVVGHEGDLFQLHLLVKISPSLVLFRCPPPGHVLQADVLGRREELLRHELAR